MRARCTTATSTRCWRYRCGRAQDRLQSGTSKIWARCKARRSQPPVTVSDAPPEPVQAAAVPLPEILSVLRFVAHGLPARSLVMQTHRADSGGHIEPVLALDRDRLQGD